MHTTSRFAQPVLSTLAALTLVVPVAALAQDEQTAARDAASQAVVHSSADQVSSQAGIDHEERGDEPAADDHSPESAARDPQTAAFPNAVDAPSDQVAGPAPSGDDLVFHGGLELRTDIGVHPLRLDLGARWQQLDAVLVLDPMALTDGQLSTDLWLQWRPADVIAMAGWRTTLIPLLDGPQLQHNLLVGAGLELPRFFGDWVEGQVGLELSSTVLKHGGGLPAELISFASGRDYIDKLNVALFIRIEGAGGLSL